GGGGVDAGTPARRQPEFSPAAPTRAAHYRRPRAGPWRITRRGRVCLRAGTGTRWAARITRGGNLLRPYALSGRLFVSRQQAGGHPAPARAGRQFRRLADRAEHTLPAQSRLHWPAT